MLQYTDLGCILRIYLCIVFQYESSLERFCYGVIELCHLNFAICNDVVDNVLNMFWCFETYQICLNM